MPVGEVYYRRIYTYDPIGLLGLRHV
jgi:hypothetical protein